MDLQLAQASLVFNKRNNPNLMPQCADFTKIFNKAKKKFKKKTLEVSAKPLGSLAKNRTKKSLV